GTPARVSVSPPPTSVAPPGHVAVALYEVKFVVPVIAVLAETTLTVGVAATASGAAISHAAIRQGTASAAATAALKLRVKLRLVIVMQPPCVARLRAAEVGACPNR